jgi:predicted TIM-barrel fold metal-dependent hydrolase
MKMEARQKGTGSPEQRLREQEEDGIDAEVLFPSRFVSSFIEGISEPAVYRSMVYAYNTFIAEDYCSFAPDRLIGTAVIPVSGIDDACAELDHIKDLGLTTVSPHQFPNGSGFAAPEDDRFWAKTLELNLRVAPHINIGEANVPPSTPGVAATGRAFTSILAGRAGPRPVFCLAQLITSGVFDRFPELEFYFAETNASWLPSALFFLDDGYELCREWFGSQLTLRPSEYVLKHCYFGMIRDPLAIQMSGLVPLDRIMWGSDFPHAAGSFPNSAAFLNDIFRGVDDNIRRQILVTTPARFFRLDVNSELASTRAPE